MGDGVTRALFVHMTPTANDFANIAARRHRRAPSEAEITLWKVLRGGRAGELRFRRQVPVDRYIADFACLRERLVIEVDGSQHVEHVAYDEARTRRLEALGFRVVRFWAADVMRDPAAIVDTIWTVVVALRRERAGRTTIPTGRIR